VMALVLAATGIFLYVRLGSELAHAIDQGLRARAKDVSALAQQPNTGLRDAHDVPGAESGFAQVIGPRGTIIDGTPGLPARPLLTAGSLATARRQARFFDQTIGAEHVRLLAQPVTAQGERLVVVAGASLGPRSEALGDLGGQLLVGGPIALLLASLAGYALATAALRPVERMGERAATIAEDSPGRRLPVPQANDEIARLGTQLNELLTRLEAALGRERALVSNTSHALRPPLALMKTEIELALAEPASAPALADALRAAGEATDRLSQLTDDLLLLARSDIGELPLRRTELSAHELINAIATRFLRRANDTGRRIDIAAPEDLVLLGDQHLLEQAVSNLVENALRHGAGTIQLEARLDDEAVTIQVSDEGDGFPPEFADRAFERFSRADGSRGTPGAGLGLAIVDTIAQAHGGSAAASSSRVTLTLPAPIGAWPPAMSATAAAANRH
jgi:two-component system OmpR family sensor kinase